MSIPKLSETTLRRKANAKSYARGEDYYRSGAVVDITQRGNTLQAEVEGNEAEPYHVRLNFDDGGLTAVACSCPYNFDGWCKHIVASLLVCLRQPERVEERPTLEQLLDRLNLSQAKQLLQELVAEQPALSEAIDQYVTLLAEPANQEQATKPIRHTAIDPAPFRREAKRILRDAVYGWESGQDENPIDYELQELIDKALAFIERADSANALLVLEAISAACAENWDEVADYGAESYQVVESLDHAWTEAILSSELTAAEKTDLEEKLQSWLDELDGDFEISLEALHQGWDYPPLQRVLQGHITDLGAWEQEAPDYATDLALIRLRILDRQQHHQEYLYLAEAENQTEQYLTKLASLGRIEDAMSAAETQLGTLEEAFALAKALRAQEALAQALDIAQLGLSLPGQAYQKHELAIWTSDLAEGLNNHSSALSARVSAFETQPSFGDYRKAQELSGDDWSTVQAKLLQILRKSPNWSGEQAKVDIFLHEGLLDDAIAAVTKLSFYRADLIRQVMDAALSEHPDWVISNACKRAEEIMDAGKANAYHHAIEWLETARAAYLASKRQAEWSAYRTQLMQTHGRKYKLMGMLQRPNLA